MKAERNILFAFLLNLGFSVFEFLGGVFTGSVAILSDAVHDAGDAFAIGVSYVLERKSKTPPDSRHTYGYARYSVLGGVITTLILLISSVIVIYNSIHRLGKPTEINYNAMILLSLLGVCINLCAALATRKGASFNQKAVNLHMLEDVLGWIVVFIGAVVMRFTDFSMLDPLMSIAVAAYIIFKATLNLKNATEVFLEKAPSGISAEDIRLALLEIEGIEEVHHLHLWTMDGEDCYATLHIVAEEYNHRTKSEAREKLSELGVAHATIEFEGTNERCCKKSCNTKPKKHHGHSHHHGK